MNKGLDSTMTDVITPGPGGGGSAPANRVEGTMRDVEAKPSPRGDGGRNRFETVSKPETPSIINSVFYDETSGSPGTLDSTMRDVLEIGFGK